MAGGGTHAAAAKRVNPTVRRRHDDPSRVIASPNRYRLGELLRSLKGVADEQNQISFIKEEIARMFLQEFGHRLEVFKGSGKNILGFEDFTERK